MGGPLVSVVMSVYNGQQYLRPSLDSVLAQEGVDFEFVVVDDGSTDQSPKMLEEYAQKDSRIRLIRQGNTGLTRALARGCSEARGELIARQDADDVSFPGRLAKLATVLQEDSGIAVADSWVEWIGPRDEPLCITRFSDVASRATEGVLHHRQSPCHGSVMFRRKDYETVGGYRPQFYFAQDSDLWFRLSDRGGFLFVPEVLYRFRVAEGSISTSHRESQLRLYELARGCWSARQNVESEEPLLAKAAQIRPGMARVGRTKKGAGAYFIGRTLLRKGDPRAAKYLWSYVQHSPWDPRGWFSVLQATLRAKMGGEE